MIYQQKDEILIRDMEERDSISICRAQGDQSEDNIQYYEKQFGHIRKNVRRIDS